MPIEQETGKGKRKYGEKPKRRFQHQSEPADWSTADPALLCKAVYVVTMSGGAIRFGYTSDGGAYAVGLYGDGDPYTEYIRPNEDIDEFLNALIAGWERT